MALTLTEAKAHVRDCIERDDVEGLQKLLDTPPLYDVVSMRTIVEKLRNDWPRLQMKATEQREFERLRKLDEPRERELEKLYSNTKRNTPMNASEPIALVLKPTLWRVIVSDSVANPTRVRHITVKGPGTARGAIDAALHTDGFEDFKKEFPLCGIAKIEFLGLLDNA